MRHLPDGGRTGIEKFLPRDDKQKGGSADEDAPRKVGGVNLAVSRVRALILGARRAILADILYYFLKYVGAVCVELYVAGNSKEIGGGHAPYKNAQ